LAKKKDNTGFRNGDLFCFNCGGSKKLVLPMEMGKAGNMMIAFADEHSECKKTWEEPHWSETEHLPIEGKIFWWFTKASRGSSSMAIYDFMTVGLLPNKRYETPSDPSDLHRCYVLLKAIPEWRERLPEMKVVGEVWARIIDEWDKLSGLLEEHMEGKKGGGILYNFMKTLGC